MLTDLRKLVLPNATVAIVNQQTHPDLYFALRGGMNNFGIVTHFTMTAVPQGPVHGGGRTFSGDKREEILEQAYQLTTTWKNDTALAFFYSFDYDPREDEFSLTMNQEYAQETSDPAPFRQLNAIPFESSTLRTDWPSNFSLDLISPAGGRYALLTIVSNLSNSKANNYQKSVCDVDLLSICRSRPRDAGYFG